MAADLACAEADLITPGISIHEARAVAGRRRYPPAATPLLMATMGAGVVVSANAARLDWLYERLAGLDRDAVFGIASAVDLAALVEPDGQIVIGPTLGYTCTTADLRSVPSPPEDVSLLTVERDDIPALHIHRGFDHALSYDVERVPGDELAVVARCGDAVVGIAAASADTDELWQIGVDVLSSAQGRGIGRAVVRRLTARILADGHVPYYTAAPSNIGSRALAIGLGYWPVFTTVRAHAGGLAQQ